MGPPITPGPPIAPCPPTIMSCGGGGSCATADPAVSKVATSNHKREVMRYLEFIVHLIAQPSARSIHDSHPANQSIFSDNHISQHSLAGTSIRGGRTRGRQLHADDLLVTRANQRVAQHQRN